MAQKSLKKARWYLPAEGGFLRKGGLNLTRNPFTRKLWNRRILFICFITIVSYMLELALFQNLFNDWIIFSPVPNLISGKIGATLSKVKYTLSIPQIYWKYTSKVYLKYILQVYLKDTSNILQITWSLLQVHFKYTSSILHPVELQKKKYTLSLLYFDKRSKFEAHFVKLNQYF